MFKICIYIGINAHVTPVTHRQTDTHVKVEQYSAEAESAKIHQNFTVNTPNSFPNSWIHF